MRPSACCCNFFNKGMPCSAVACAPEVRIRLQPNSMICSSASCGLRHTSKARWNVTDIPCETSISCLIKDRSTSPLAVRQPNTTTTAPNRRALSISFSIMRCSMGEYRKSPPRGRMMTCRRVFVKASRAMTISP